MNQYEYQAILQNGGITVDEAVERIKHHHAVAGDTTEYWYEYACRKLQDLGFLSISSINSPGKIMVHLATLALITEEFQTIALDEEPLFEYDYESYLPDLPLNWLEDVYDRFFKGIDFFEDADALLDECDDEEEMHAKICERLIELDRGVIVDALGFGRQGHEDIFIALALTSRLPSGDFEDYADMIEQEYPVDVDDLRDRDGFASFKEYKKYIESDEAAEFVYGDLCDMSTPSLSKAFSWVGGGCPKEL